MAFLSGVKMLWLPNLVSEPQFGHSLWGGRDGACGREHKHCSKLGASIRCVV